MYDYKGQQVQSPASSVNVINISFMNSWSSILNVLWFLILIFFIPVT